MHPAYRSLILVFCISGVAEASESLDKFPSADLGLYGSAWISWIGDHPGRTDFIIYQVGPNRPAQKIADDIKTARHHGLQIVLAPKLPSIEGIASVELKEKIVLETITGALDPLDKVSLKAIVIGEENVFWDDWARVLTFAYDRLHQIYPDRQFYQWYSPSKSLNIPGEGKWPDLPADGWVFDQYHYNAGEYGHYVERMLAKGKPLISVVWASPMWQPGNSKSEASGQWWETTGWQLFYQQVRTNLAHGIPTVFFAYEKQLSGETVPLFRSADDCSHAFLEALTTKTFDALRASSELPPLPAARPAWIPTSCGD